MQVGQKSKGFKLLSVNLVATSRSFRSSGYTYFFLVDLKYVFCKLVQFCFSAFSTENDLCNSYRMYDLLIVFQLKFLFCSTIFWLKKCYFYFFGELFKPKYIYEKYMLQFWLILLLLFFFFQNSNVLSAVLLLIKELDYSSLEIVENAVRSSLNDFEENWLSIYNITLSKFII